MALAKIFTTVCFIFYLHLSISESPLPNTSLFNYLEYMEDVVQTMMLDLEKEGICNLKMRDFSQSINESLYGFNVLGDLKYSGGFVISMDGFSIKKNSTNRYLSNSDLTTAVKTTLVLEGLDFCYDLQADLKGDKHIATGIYELASIEYLVTVEKGLATHVISSNMTSISVMNTKNGRMQYLPSNDFTAVFSRVFNNRLPDVSGSFSDWATGILAEILQKVVTEKISFPKIDFDTLS